MPTPEQDSRLQVVSYTRDVEGHSSTLLYGLKSRTSLRRIVALSFCAVVHTRFCSLLSESNGDSSTAFLTMDEAMVKTRFMEAVVSAPYCVEATSLREARLSIACCICRGEWHWCTGPRRSGENMPERVVPASHRQKPRPGRNGAMRAVRAPISCESLCTSSRSWRTLCWTRLSSRCAIDSFLGATSLLAMARKCD